MKHVTFAAFKSLEHLMLFLDAINEPVSRFALYDLGINEVLSTKRFLILRIASKCKDSTSVYRVLTSE